MNELKLFAQVQEGAQNAAMEFDPETLAPTYRLLQGVPGQSNAFVIAARLGLPAAVLEQARSFLRQEHGNMEKMIASLVEDQRRLEQDSREAARDRARALALRRQMEEEKEKLELKREEILRQAREEARHLLRHTKATVDKRIRELQELRKAGTGNGEVLAQAEELRRELHALRRETEQGLESKEELPPPELELAPGKAVFVQSLKQEGEIISCSDDGALVQIGAMKVHVPRQDLRLLRVPEGREKPPAGGYTMQKSRAVRPEVDLRGMTVEEAVPAVEKLFDDALWAGLSRVTLIHGRGTGKLMQGLHAYLQGHPLVKSFRLGQPGEGGTGVTIVELKSK
jgi:DNA mismatch repair protein MutS2